MPAADLMRASLLSLRVRVVSTVAGEPWEWLGLSVGVVSGEVGRRLGLGLPR